MEDRVSLVAFQLLSTYLSHIPAMPIMRPRIGSETTQNKRKRVYNNYQPLGEFQADIVQY